MPVQASIADLYTAVNISGLLFNVGTLLLGFIGVGLLFTGIMFLKHSGIRS